MSSTTERAMTFAEAFDLPLTIDMRTAARVFGVCTATAYKLVHHGHFPCPVVRVGHQYRVPTAAMLRALEVEELPVYAADLAAGAEYAAITSRTTSAKEDLQ